MTKFHLTALSDHHELKCLCYWQLLLRTLAKISDKFSLMIVNKGIHFEILKQLIDPPKSSENQEVGTNFVITFDTGCTCNTCCDLISQKNQFHLHLADGMIFINDAKVEISLFEFEQVSCFSLYTVYVLI